MLRLRICSKPQNLAKRSRLAFQLIDFDLDATIFIFIQKKRRNPPCADSWGLFRNSLLLLLKVCAASVIRESNKTAHRMIFDRIVSVS